MNAIAVLITCHNRKEKTLKCLEKLFTQAAGLDVFLVDDGCTDGTAEVVKKQYPQVNMVKGDGTLFWNRGMYAAWCAAEIKDYDFYLWLNDDICLFENALQMMLDSSTTCDHQSLIVGASCSPCDPSVTTFSADYQGKALYPNGALQSCDAFGGNFVLVPRFVYQTCGKLDPYYHHSFGDIDYAKTVINKGVKIYLAPKHVGFCEFDFKPRIWQDKSKSLRERIESLHSPLGYMNPKEVFYFYRKHENIVKAFLRVLYIYFKVIFKIKLNYDNMTAPFIFQINSNIVKDTYRNNPNYLVKYSETEGNHEYCAIYFCSNDIYYPNNEHVFRNRIVEKNFYEWYSTRILKAHKHIYVRDIFKQWYLQGVNSTIHSPELLLDFLRKETDGYRVITVGSSSGGYAAILYGSQLNAEKVIAFNPQIELESILTEGSEEFDPLIFRLKDKPERKYYELLRWLNTQTDVFYIYSGKSQQDIKQYQYLKKAENTYRIHTIGFDTSHHGIPFLKVCLPKFINANTEVLNSLTDKVHHPYFFSVQMVGLWKTLRGLISQLYKAYLSKFFSLFF